MKRSNDFYKVVNAILNTLRQGDSVVYVSGGQGGSGIGTFSPSDDFEVIRTSLLQFGSIEQLDVDDEDFGELYNDWAESDDFDSSFDFYEFTRCVNCATLQVMINPDNYITSSHDLRDMICEDYDLEGAEITTGMNGYPRGLRGCVLLNDGDKTFEQMEDIAERYGVEIVSLHRKAGWNLWESQGTAYELYNYQDFQDNHDDNVVSFCDFKSYAEYLRETAYELKYRDVVVELAARAEIDALADKIEGNELEENMFVWVNTHDIKDYEVEKIMCDHFEYDSHYYTLALDCMIED